MLYPPLTDAQLSGVTGADTRIQLQQAQSQLQNNARSTLLQIVKRSDDATGFVVLAGKAEEVRGSIPEPTTIGRTLMLSSSSKAVDQQPAHQRRAAKKQDVLAGFYFELGDLHVQITPVVPVDVLQRRDPTYLWMWSRKTAIGE